LVAAAADFPKPYSPPCVERENVFAFTERPAIKFLGDDKYEITFAVKGYCDVTAVIIDPLRGAGGAEQGVVVRHLASGVLGANAPAPFQKNSLKQTIYWDGKDDLDYYVKEPQKMMLRVMLGLKPEFDKLLGGSSPYNPPGFVLGLAADEEGVYVFSRGQGSHNNVHLCKFDHDGKYVASLAPPPADLAEDKLGGRTYVEYEPGKRAHHGPKIMEDMGYAGNTLPGLGGKSVADIQPVVVGKRIFFCNGGPGHRAGKVIPSMLYYVFTDGSTDAKGLAGRFFVDWETKHLWPRFAAAPDGKTLYMTGVDGSRSGIAPFVLQYATDGDEAVKLFFGKMTRRGKSISFEPGNDNESLNSPQGLACDAQGRVYVADGYNNRIQISSPEGKYLKTIPVDRPRLLCVHRQTGAIYVQHMANDKGRTANRLSKFGSFDDPTPKASLDGVETSSMALDSWSPTPRLWIGCGIHTQGSTIEALYRDRGPSVLVFEEAGNTFKKILDFDEEAQKEAGANYMGRWSGGVFDRVYCDPVREQLYYKVFRNHGWVFDLASGSFLKKIRFPGQMNDIDFCKRGYLHAHFDPGFYLPGVGRLDPDQGSEYVDHIGKRYPDQTVLTEVPYEYGIELTRDNRRAWAGGLPVRDQPGAKYFQDGFGVDMRGNMAVQSNIYYVPKMEEDGWKAADAGRGIRDATGQLSGPSRYPEFVRYVQDMQKRGEEVYYIKRKPGLPLIGGTIWTFDWTGELRQECAVIVEKLVLGVQMDEDGCLYFGNDRGKLTNGEPFLYKKGGNFGLAEPIVPYNRTPGTGVWVKSRGKDVEWLLKNATTPLDPLPARSPDLHDYSAFGSPETQNVAWVEGAHWIYAGLSPMVPSGCTCPSVRPCLDWFKRSFVPEAYCHTIAVLDTNGNLVLRIGSYGNWDSGHGPRSKIPVPDGIGLTLPRFLSATDNYLAFDDWGERLAVLKLNYHAQETVPIQMRGK
jgi:hypothetical protein